MARKVVDLTGQVFGRLTVLHRGPTPPAPPGKTKTYWTCRCECGATVDVWMGNLRKGTARSCGCYKRELAASQLRGRSGEKNYAWSPDDRLTYSGAHQRVARNRGSAAAFTCADCAAPALHWSYTYTCPSEIERGGQTYCPHPEHYTPRCVPCHSVHDKAKSGEQNTQMDREGEMHDGTLNSQSMFTSRTAEVVALAQENRGHHAV